MKKLYVMIVLAGLCYFCGSRSENMDRPLRGEWDFQLKKAWETGQIGEDVLVRIQGLAVNREGNIFLWDSRQAAVFVCNPRGKLLYRFGARGEGPGEVLDRWATRLFLTKKYIILHEVNTGRIHYFLHDGEFEKTEKILQAKYARALKTFIDADRFLFFLSEETQGKHESFLGIYHLSTGNYEKITDMPADDPLSVNDEEAGNISLHDPDVAAVLVCAQFDGEKIFYGRNDRYVITGVDLKTKKTVSLSITGRKGSKISEATKNSRFKKLPLNKKLLELLIKKCPDRTNFFNRIFVDNKGLIYVFVPDWEKENSFEIDIFSPAGKYLYHSLIRVPAEYNKIRSLTFNDNDLYFTAEDRDGEIKLVKFTITPPKM